MNNILKNKKKYIIFITILTILFCYGFGFCCADEQQNVNTVSDNNVQIEEYISEISDVLKKIDKEIINMKSQKEYIKYPAVRLNVQTPFLGIAAMTENRLEIKENVSFFDITQSYSVRDVVNKKIIKIPSFNIGSIVILTRDLNLNEDITQEESNQAIYYLKDYLMKVNDVLKFVVDQKNNIFADYISKEIKEKVNNIKQEVSNIQLELLNNDDKLTFIELLQQADSEDYKKLELELINIFDASNDILIKVDNILISDQELSLTKTSLDNLKLKTENYIKSLNSVYETECLNIDRASFLNNFKKAITNVKEPIENYVKSSKIEKIIEGDEEYISNEIVDIYEVRENDAITSIEELEKEIDQLILKNNEKINDISNQNIEKIYTDVEDVNFVNNLVLKYKNLLKKVQNFYEVNYEYMSQNLIKKVENLIKNTDTNVSKYIKVLYFDIPNEIDDQKSNNMNICTYLKTYIMYMNKNVNNLVSYYLEIKSEYEIKVEQGQIES